jgi:hypothetical protein
VAVERPISRIACAIKRRLRCLSATKTRSNASLMLARTWVNEPMTAPASHALGFIPTASMEYRQAAA